MRTPLLTIKQETEMKRARSNILLIDDNPTDRLAFKQLIKNESLPYRHKMAKTLAQANALLSTERFDIIIANYLLKDGTALEILSQKKDMPLIVISQPGDEEIAIQALNAGAHDYLTKDADRNYLRVLPLIIENVLRHTKTDEQLQILSLAVEQSASSIIITDAKGNIEYVNAGFTQITGYTPSEVIGKNPRILKSGTTSPAEYQKLWRTITSRGEWRGEFRNKKKNGEMYWESACISAIKRKDGEISHFLAVKEDITERKNSLEALGESEERYRRFFEHDLAGDFICTARGKLLDCNPAFARIFGFSSIQKALTCNLASLFTNSKVWAAFIAKIQAEKKVELYEIDLRRRNGDSVFVIANAVGIFDKQNKLVKLQGYLFDITQKKSLEEQLLQAQKMESLGTLAGGIAHDFNNLLAAILGYASFMKMRITDEHPFFKELDIIERSASRAADLTAQLLAFARGGKYIIKAINLNNIVQDTVKILNRTIDKLIEIETDLTEYLPPVEADAGQIQQVIMNLCLNARDAMPGGGKMTIKTGIATIDDDYFKSYNEVKGGGFVTFAVSDNGIGMDKKTMQKIFEPFFTTKEKGKGSGLGLSSVYGIVKNHGGFIHVSSEPDKGSTFRIYLPVSHKGVLQEVPNAEPLVNMPHGTNECILVVDDEEHIRSLAKDILENYGYRVLLADDGEMAIRLFELHKQEISLVLLDMIMPKMGGLETFIRLKELSPEVKALLSTGYQKDGKAQDILCQGIHGFVQKPYQIAELLTQIRRVIDSFSEMKKVAC
jgi:two-component system cell cycle sensor histidine kinase/response regulator CckA